MTAALGHVGGIAGFHDTSVLPIIILWGLKLRYDPRRS